MGSNPSNNNHNNDEKRMQEKAIEDLRRQLKAKNHKIQQLRIQKQTLSKALTQGNKKLMKEYTVETLMKMNYSMFTCPACQNFYDEEVRSPMMVCKNQHTVCDDCFKSKQKDKKANCFQCKHKLQNFGVNRGVYNLITNKQQLLEWVKHRDKTSQSSSKDISFDLNSANLFRIQLCRFMAYDKMFQMNEDSLLKISSEASWHTIRSVEALKPYSKSTVSFKTINSVHNSIIFGITTQSQQFQKSFIPSQSIAFHLNNGHIYDEDTNLGSYKWRGGGKPVVKNTNPQVVMEVDTYQRKVRWKIKGTIYGQAKFNNKFDTKPIYVYISLYHKGDMIVFNK